MRKTVPSDIQISQNEFKNEAQPSFFFNPLLGVWIPDENVYQLFDISSQTDRKTPRKRNKITKIYEDKEFVSKPPSRQ